MRRAGWILVGIAFGAAVLAALVDRENVWLLSAFGLGFLLGFALLGADAARRLYRGDLKLRPWLAARESVRVFAVLVVLRLLAGLVYPPLNSGVADVVVPSALFAIGSTLYGTAYRRPA